MESDVYQLECWLMDNDPEVDIANLNQERVFNLEGKRLTLGSAVEVLILVKTFYGLIE
jgi:hypothetical protein